MHYSAAFNPANTVKAGKVSSRCSNKYDVDRKGVDFSAVLNELDIRTKSFGLLAGFTGENIVRLSKINCGR